MLIIRINKEFKIIEIITKTFSFNQSCLDKHYLVNNIEKYGAV